MGFPRILSVRLQLQTIRCLRMVRLASSNLVLLSTTLIIVFFSFIKFIHMLFKTICKTIDKKHLLQKQHNYSNSEVCHIFHSYNLQCTMVKFNNLFTCLKNINSKLYTYCIQCILLLNLNKSLVKKVYSLGSLS